MPKYDGVELKATKRAFYQGVLVEKGALIRFTGEVLPKWAKAPADADVVIAAEAAKEKASVGDTKPKAAQAAVRQKAAAVTGG